MKERTQILVVGAGPVGVVAAYRLAQKGLDVILIEAEASCREDMRASTWHPPTLEMMAELGVLDTLESEGLRAPVYHYRNRKTNEVIAFDMGELADITPYPYRLQCEQFKASRLLTRLIDESPNGSVRFSRRLLSFEQDATGVTVHVEGPLQVETIRADYVIAADGANSVVRKWLGIPFDGFTYPEKFLTLSTRWPIDKDIPGLAAVNYVADTHEWCVLLRVPQYWRVLVPSSDESDSALTSDEKKTAVFANLIGRKNAEELGTHHRTIYRVHQRVASTYRQGRVLLAGDAAHLNNPLGGFGMNSGVHDVWNLTEKLLAIYEGDTAAEALLDLYDRQRRTIMHEFVQAQTVRNKVALEAGSAEAQKAHESEMRAILANDERRRDYLMTQSMVKSLARANSIA
ncbi:MAG: FAD-dependent oxidoreductase [Rhizomicrobium sp.]